MQPFLVHRWKKYFDIYAQVYSNGHYITWALPIQTPLCSDHRIFIIIMKKKDFFFFFFWVECMTDIYTWQGGLLLMVHGIIKPPAKNCGKRRIHKIYRENFFYFSWDPILPIINVHTCYAYIYLFVRIDGYFILFLDRGGGTVLFDSKQNFSTDFFFLSIPKVFIFKMHQRKSDALCTIFQHVFYFLVNRFWY